MSQILVIGASGKTGRHVTLGLASRGATVRAGSRNPGPTAAERIDPIRFDWHDDETWGPALEGTDAIYLVKPESQDVLEVVRKFLVAAKAAGAQRLVFLSECATHTRSDDVTERQVERVVESSDLQWTILRPSWFMQDIVDDHFFGPMVRNERIIMMTTGGSAIAWIDARDIAEVATELLLNGGSVGQALDLTGPEALTLADLAKRITAVVDCPVHGVEETVTDAEARMRTNGLDENTIAYMTRIAESIVAGHTASVTGEVERVTGRAPRSLVSFLEEHAVRLRRVGDVRVDDGAEQAPDCARDNEAIFRRLVFAWARSDFDVLVDCFAEDMVYTDMPFPEAPVRGRRAFRQHVEAYNAMFADGQVDVELMTVVASSTHVVGELLCRTRYIGPGAPEAGVPVSWYATLIDTIVDGKVISEHAYFDPTAFEKAVQQARV